jgi:CheY-like chemotaxis protein
MRGIDKPRLNRKTDTHYYKCSVMNPSGRTPDSTPSAQSSAADASGLRRMAGRHGTTSPDEQEMQRWHELVGQLGRELAEPLTAALERVTTLTTSGRIDRMGLRALRDDIDHARQAGIWCQQISRLASGRIRQTHERVHLTNTVQSLLAYRAREIQGKGIQLKQSLSPIEVQIDASMLFGLLNAVIDWWLDCAQGTVELQIDAANWPVRAQLSSSFALAPADHPVPTAEAAAASLNTLHWHLLEQTARTLGLVYERHVHGHQVLLTLTFPGTISALMADPDASAGTGTGTGTHGFADSINSKPLAGSHVLIVASRRDVRLQVREAIKSMGLVLDFVGSVREAVEFCREGLPHAIVFEASLRSTPFEQLVGSIRQEVPEFVFIELVEGGRSFDIATISSSGMARVGSEGIANALPSALVYELSRVI